MNMFRNVLKNTLNYALTFLRWVLAAAIVGAVCGLAGALFAIGVEEATHLRQHNEWVIWLLPLGGLAIAGLYKLLKLPLSLGTDEIIKTVRTQGKVPLAMAPAIFLSTVLTHLLGGSAGREGAALQLGGSIGAALGDLTHPSREKDDRRIFELCGMAALFSALFGTPFTAAVFVLEIIEVGKFNHRAFLPCVVSAVTAKLTALAVGAPVEIFPLASQLVAVNTVSVLQSAGVGVACGLVAILFCVVMHFDNKLMKKWIPNGFVRIAVGGAAVIALTLLVGSQDYNGGGMHVIFAALAGEAVPFAFLLKILFTAVSLGSGFKGGEIVPSFFVGATLGCTAAGLIGLNPAVGAAVGLISVFCGVTNAPLASLLLSVELFGTEYLPLIGTGLAVSFMLSGHFSLYHEQLFVSPKLGSSETEIHAHDESVAA